MKIFVSGTFADMDAARDILNKQVCPRLNQRTRKFYGQEIDLTDLRRGIDTESADNAAAKATLACLEACDEAAPPMPFIILLGERCSRSLDPSIIELAEREFGFTVENKACGITELEIEYGVLRDEACRRRAVVCCIDREGVQPEPTMAALRQKLAARLAHGQILHFTRTARGIISREENLPFAEVLTDTLWQHLRDNLALPDENTQDFTVHRTYMQKKALGFRSRRRLFDRCMQALHEKASYIFLRDRAGTGKSSLLSRLLVEWGEQNDAARAIPIFCGLTENVDTGMEVLQRIVRHLEHALGKPQGSPDSFDAWKDYEESLCLEYEDAALPTLLFGVDAVDKLRVGEIVQKLLFLPQGSYKNLQFIISFTPAINLPRRFERCPSFALGNIDEQEMREIIRDILSEYNKRELSREVEDRLVEVARRSVPLELNLAVQALRMMDATEFDVAHKEPSMQDINLAQLAIIERLTEGMGTRISHDLLLFSRRFLQFACERIDERLYTALRHIAAAPYGLPVEMLKALDPDNFDEENFLLLRHYLQEVFILRADGRYDFAHKCLRQALVFTNLDGMSDDIALSRRLFNALYALEDDHPLRTSDILYFANQCKLYNFITDYIINAYWDGTRRYRRRGIRQQLRNRALLHSLIYNLPQYVARGETVEGGAHAILHDKTRRLFRFNSVFGGDLLASECLVQEVKKELDALCEQLAQHCEDLPLSAVPYISLVRDWFINCARYGRYMVDLLSFNGGEWEPPTRITQWSRATVALFDGAFFAHVSEETKQRFDAMDSKAFAQAFLSDPENTYHQLFGVWLAADCAYDLPRLFDNYTENIERGLLRVFCAVAEMSRAIPERASRIRDILLPLYGKVYMRATALNVNMKTWAEFLDLEDATEEAPTDVFCALLHDYRDLEYHETAKKYTDFLNAAETAIAFSTFSEAEENITTCRNAIRAAERALRFTDGRRDYIKFYFDFCAALREQLTKLTAPFLLTEMQAVYEQQFAFLRENAAAIPSAAYSDLLCLRYSEHMLALYAAHDAMPAAEDKRRWHTTEFLTAVHLLSALQNDPSIGDVGEPPPMSPDKLIPPEEKHKFAMEDEYFDEDEQPADAAFQWRVMSVVAVAVEALRAINRTAPDFDAGSEAKQMYDDLETGVIENFEDGAVLYSDHDLKRRIRELCRENAYPRFTALLERVDELLTPFTMP